MVRRVVPCQRSTHLGLVSVGHEYAACRGGVRVINVPQYLGFVGHKSFVVRGFVGYEWEADQRLCYGSASGVVNAVDHL